MVVDCEKVIKGGSSQNEVDFDRIYDIKGEVERIRCLDNEVEVVKKIRGEFEKIDKWHEELDKVTEYDQEGRVVKSDRQLLKSLIQKARSQIKININKEIDEIES